MFKKLSAALAVAALIALAPVSYAQAPAPAPAASATPGNFGSAAPAAVGVSTPGAPVVVATTDKPDYTVSGGSIIVSVIDWLHLAFKGLIVLVVVAGITKGLSLMGVQTNQQMNDRLVEMATNGVNEAASRAKANLDGKFPIEVKNKIVQEAIEYTKAHGADTIKALGLDPEKGEVSAALRAKIETIIVDPKIPTNPGLVANAPAADTATMATSGRA